jgi:hypothetical protein
MKIKEHNLTTGEVTERDMTADELQQYEIDQATLRANEAAMELKAAAKIALLERLGLTDDEAKLLLS